MLNSQYKIKDPTIRTTKIKNKETQCKIKDPMKLMIKIKTKSLLMIQQE